VFKAIGKYVPPPAGVKPPSLWGVEDRLVELFGLAIKDIRATKREFVFRYRSPAHFLETFRTYYGPMHKAFAALDTAGQAALTQDLRALMDKFNRSGNMTLAIPSEYLEVVIVRR
jgi:hypothetical protein